MNPYDRVELVKHLSNFYQKDTSALIEAVNQIELSLFNEPEPTTRFELAGGFADKCEPNEDGECCCT